MKISIPIGKRGELRIVQPGDVNESYIAGLNNPDLTQYMAFESGHVETQESVTEYVKNAIESEDSFLFGLFSDGKLIGTSRLHDIKNQNACLGIFIFDQSEHGKGWASEAIAEISDYAFKNLAVESIEAGIYRINEASRRCFAKAGFEFEKTDPAYKEQIREIWIKRKSA